MFNKAVIQEIINDNLLIKRISSNNISNIQLTKDYTQSQITQILKALIHNTSIKTLEFSGRCSVNRYEALLIAQILQNNKSLEKLVLLDRSIGSQGTIAIAKAIEQQEHKALQELNLDRSDLACFGFSHYDGGAPKETGEDAYQALKQAFEHHPSLKKISVSGCSISKKPKIELTDNDILIKQPTPIENPAGLVQPESRQTHLAADTPAIISATKHRIQNHPSSHESKPIFSTIPTNANVRSNCFVM